MTIKLTEADVQNCTWTVTGQDEFYRYSIGHGTHPVTGVPIEVVRKEFLADEELQALNHEERASRDTKPWSAGLGSEKGGNVPMVRVGRIPLAKFYSDLVPKMREGDKEHMRWFLNRDENTPFRTRSGKV